MKTEQLQQRAFTESLRNHVIGTTVTAWRAGGGTFSAASPHSARNRPKGVALRSQQTQGAEA